ncbi:MAG: TetR/AcrR family transcriptional regulator [Chthonomonas sp.]|nr:TetR/AcrR family transcriptional regulator [Chthonomonas sp.]
MDRRTELLKCAYEIVGRDGLEGLHARAVASELGINHATVHYYFPTRNDLLLALVDYAEERFLKDREAILARASDPISKMEAEIALYEAYCRPASRFFRVWTSLFVAAQSSDVLRDRLRRFSNVWTQRFADTKNLAGYATTLSQGPLAEPYTFIATMLGLGLMAQLHQNLDDTRFRIDKIVDTVFERKPD